MALPPRCSAAVWLQHITPTDIAVHSRFRLRCADKFVGNTGVGGWSSFAFPNLPKPIGVSRTVAISPYARPSMVFDGNTARSSGFWWGNAGALDCTSCSHGAQGCWSGVSTRRPYCVASVFTVQGASTSARGSITIPLTRTASSTIPAASRAPPLRTASQTCSQIPSWHCATASA